MTTDVAVAAGGVDSTRRTVDHDFRMWLAYVDTGWWSPAADSVRFSDRMHLTRWQQRNGVPASPFTPIEIPARMVRDFDACTVEALHYERRIWAYGVRPVTVEDLAPVDTVKVTTALRDPARVDIVPSRPEDLNQIPPTALPRSGDPAPVANRRGVCGHHTARTSHGGAPPT